jgi:hypothetical protein
MFHKMGLVERSRPILQPIELGCANRRGKVKKSEGASACGVLPRHYVQLLLLGPVCCGNQIVWQALRCRRGCLGNIYDSDDFDNRTKNKEASSLVIATSRRVHHLDCFR